MDYCQPPWCPGNWTPEITSHFGSVSWDAPTGTAQTDGSRPASPGQGQKWTIYYRHSARLSFVRCYTAPTRSFWQHFSLCAVLSPPPAPGVPGHCLPACGPCSFCLDFHPIPFTSHTRFPKLLLSVRLPTVWEHPSPCPCRQGDGGAFTAFSTWQHNIFQGIKLFRI